MDKDEAPSLRDSIEASYDADVAAPSSAPEVVEPVIPASKDKFADEPAAAASSETTTQEGDKTAEPAAAAKPAVATAPKPAKMPPGFHDVNEWAALPEGTKQFIRKREVEAANGIQKYQGAAKFASEIAGVMRPYEWMLQAKGVPPAQVIKETMQMNAILTSGTAREKHEMFARMAQHYGVDIAGLQANQPPQERPVDPAMQSLMQKVNRMEQNERAYAEHQARQEAQQAWGAVEQMANDPKYEHLDIVKNKMANLIEAGEASTLDDAYQQAMWARPDTRALLQQKEAAKRAKDARAAAAESTAHGGNAIAGSTKPQSGSLRSTIERAFEQHA